MKTFLSKFRVRKRIIPMAWDMQFDNYGFMQTMPTEFLPVYVVQVKGTLWWHDVKVFENIRNAVTFRNKLKQKDHGEI